MVVCVYTRYLFLDLKDYKYQENGFFGHPEVLHISFLILQYAEITSIISFKYFILIDIVKKLKQWSRSAGNILLIKNETSETWCKNTELNSVPQGIACESFIKGHRGLATEENIKEISIHVHKHLKPLNDEQFGHYLAGLIDGDGHFSVQQQLVIAFSDEDLSLAYYIKEKLGYGSVKKVKNKNAYILVISSKDGIMKVLNLINEKLRNLNKFNQVINNILTKSNYSNENIKFIINNSNNYDNYYITGFSDADASFQIKIIYRKNRDKPEIRLNYQVDQKYKDLLILIKENFGGNIGYRKNQDTYYYGSTNFGSAKKIIKYFDTYHLQSSKYINYLKWRKVYTIIQTRDHLTESGIIKIKKIKNSMNKKLSIK